MNTATIFYLISVGIVFIIAVIAIMHKRSQAKTNMRAPQREPRFSNLQSTDKEFDQDELLESAAEDEEPYEYVGKAVTVKPARREESIEFPEENEQALIEENPMEEHEDVQPQDFIVINILADEHRPYSGYELLQALLTAGLRYGKMSIFHRHEEVSGRGNVLFSLASAVEPGYFDLPRMGAFSTPGLTMFMQVAEQKDPLKTFELMLNTAQHLVDDLAGEICDETRQNLTQTKIQHWRSQLLAASRSKQTSNFAS